ncbi:MAG: hypothetical protein WB988_17430 [Candidatus Nitrosopolaris sp.]|jgi:hypothetical protein
MRRGTLRSYAGQIDFTHIQNVFHHFGIVMQGGLAFQSKIDDEMTEISIIEERLKELRIKENRTAKEQKEMARLDI